MGSLATFLRRIGIERWRANRSATNTESEIADVEFRIPSMVCEGCAEKIDDVLHALPGIRDIRPNVPQKRIRVQFEPRRVDLEQLKRALTTAGFAAVEAERP